MNIFRHNNNQGYKVALINVPRICTAATFADDSLLFLHGQGKPSTATVRRWMRAGKVEVVTLCGKRYIQLHKTLLRYGLAY